MVRKEEKSLAVSFKECRNYTPAKAFQSDETKALVLECRERGEEEVASFLTLELIALSRFLNLNKGLTEEHIDYIVDKLLHDECYKWFKMADIAIIIDRIKCNKYGNFYENFNAQKFFEVLQQYDSERTQAIEQVRIQENAEYKKDYKPDVELNYYYDENGKFHYTEAYLKAQEAKKAKEEAIKAETERMRKVAEAARQLYNEQNNTNEK